MELPLYGNDFLNFTFCFLLFTIVADGMMKPRILLVNPAIYDFAAYDFWLKPYGMLSVAGKLRGRADFVLFDYLDLPTGGAGAGSILKKSAAPNV